VNNQAGAYAAIDESGNVAKHERHQIGRFASVLLFRAAFVAAAIGTAALVVTPPEGFSR
jgi:hypothetical protein